MAIDLNALASATLTAQGLSGLILATPQSVGYQPQSPAVDLKTFLFDYETENSISLESDITDHFVEDNTSIADQIALKPEVISTTGYIGELTDILPAPLQALKTAAERLTLVQAYAPALTVAAQIAYSQAVAAYQTQSTIASAAVSAWNLNGSSQNKQQIAFQRFYGYWMARALFTIQTPWAIFKDMAIAKCRPTQDEDTRMISGFEVSFKKIRFAQTTTTGNASKFQGRAAAQASGVVNFGVGTLGARVPLISAVG